ncbi:hypothetical protein ACEQ8H_002890 [Pleosporales sp. CAS-2024a]
MLLNTLVALTALAAPIAAVKCHQGAIFQLKCGTDYDGHIIGATQAGSFADCAHSCSWVSGCTTFNYKGEFCYLLGDKPGSARPSSDVDAGILIKNATLPSLSASSCGDVIDCLAPGTHDCLKKTSIGTFRTSCNTDYYGEDLALSRTKDLGDCIAQCADFSGCKAVAWSTGTCYLKSAARNVIYSQWVDAARLVPTV